MQIKFFRECDGSERVQITLKVKTIVKAKRNIGKEFSMDQREKCNESNILYTCN